MKKDTESIAFEPEQNPNTLTTAPPKPTGRVIARMALRSTVWVSLGTYFNLFIGFVATLVLTRLLAPEIFGVFSMAVFWSSLLDLRTKAGLSYAAIRQPNTDGDLLGTYYALDLITAVGSFLLSAIVTVLLWQAGYELIVSLITFLLVVVNSISALVSPLGVVLEKELHLSRVTLVSLIGSVAAYTLAISLAAAGKGIWSLLVINATTTLVAMAGNVWLCWRRCPYIFSFRWRFDWVLAKRLFRQGISVGLSMMAMGTIVSHYDDFLIGTFAGYTTLGFYDRAYRIASWPSMFLTLALNRVGFVTFAKLQDDLPRLTHAVRLSLWVLLVLGMPIVLVLFFGASDIVHLLYGPAWAESAFFLRFLIIYSFITPFLGLGNWLSIALGNERMTMLFAIVQAVVIVLIATPLTLRWGVMGTIIGVGVTFAIGFSLAFYYVFRQVPLSAKAVFGPALGAFGVAVLALLALPYLLNWNELLPFVRLLVIGLVGPGAFLSCLSALRPTEMIERLLYLRQIWSKP